MKIRPYADYKDVAVERGFWRWYNFLKEDVAHQLRRRRRNLTLLPYSLLSGSTATRRAAPSLSLRRSTNCVEMCTTLQN